jgi:hypothetical protein
MNEKSLEASPILVIGMHRSGTRLLDDILGSLGVFMGADRQADGESVTFLRVNDAIFHQCGTFWNEPMPVHFVLSDPDLLGRATAVARDELDALFLNYSGRPDWRLDSFPDETPPFGWKDPRNTFTLPVWKQIFPRLRVIHVVRHGADVAASLVRRHGKTVREATNSAVPPPLTVIRDHGLGILSSRRGWTLSEALTMWEQYVEKARLEAAALGDRAMEIRFEDLVQRPRDHIPAIAAFCGVPETEESANVPARVDPSRAFAFRADKKLTQMAEAFREVLDRLGYAP